MLVTYKLAASFLAICSITKASLTPMSSTSIPPSSGRVIRQNSALSQFLSDGSVASNEVDDRMRSRSSVDSTGTPSVAESEGSAEHVEDAIDEGLYSRQLYVLGRDAQRALQKAKVLVVGCTGPGVELAKNVALAGVAELCLCDPAPVQWHDLASHFYATPADVAAGTSRAEAAARHVASLNPHVKITIVVPPVDADATVAALGGDITAVAATAMVASGEWAVVVAVDQPEDVQLSMNDAARGKTASVASTDGKRSTKKNPTTSDEGAGGAAPCAFIACNARGVFGNVFCDFGDIFIVRDPTGTPPEPKPLDDVRALYQPRKITGASAATTSSTGAVQEHEECVEVEVVEGERHCLSAGQRVHLADLTWAPAPPQAPSGDETAPAVPHSGSDRGSREGFPSELTGTVTRLKGPAVAVVRLDNIPGQSTPAGATVAAGAAAWSGKLASGSVVRPKSDEAWKVPFQPLRALLKRPAVAPVRPRRPKKGSPEAIQAAAVEAAAKAAGTTKLEPVKVEPCPMVPCDFAKSADRNRVATIHACWHFALPRFLENAKHDGTGSSKFAGGTTAKVATEQAAARAEFLDNVKAAFAEESEKPGGGALGSGVEVDLATARAFAHCVVAGTGSGTGSAAVCLAPVASFVGGVAAQEVLKAVSRVFNPVEQFLYFDAVEALPPLPDDDDSDVVPASESTSGKSGDSLSENVDVSEEDAGSGDGNESEDDESDEEDDDGDDDDEDDSSADESAEGNESEDDNETEQDSDLSSSSYAASFAPRGDRYDGARSLLGAAVCQDLAQQRWFMVGAGAIGCELLKNLALLGVATSSGWLAITDMDTIERSNLNRQFLFRSSDVGKAKAVAAAEACRRLNEHVVLRTWQTAVNEASESPGGFDDSFWSSLDGVLTALDNLDARLFVDSRCVKYGLPLLDAGTLGAKGNVQVVLPHVTESYGDSADPPEPAVPVCTLKSFPYKIEHTIQWARELFEECFTAMPARAEAMVEVATDALAKPAADAAQEEAPGGDEGSASPGKKKKKKKESRAASKKHSSRGIQKAQNQLAARAVVAAALETNDGSEEDALVMLQRAGRAVKCLEEAVSSTSSSSPPTTVTIETVTTNAKEGSEEGGALLAARCLEWAAFELVSEKVVGEVKAVLAQHPAGTIDTETGLPFWQGTRRLPAAPVLDTNPEGGQAALVVAAARLRVDNFLGTQEDVSPESKVSLAAQRAAAIAGLTPEAAADAIARVAKRTAAAQQASNKRDASKATAKEAEASLEGSGNDVVSTEKEKALLSAAALLVKHARWRQAASASVARSRFTGPLQPLEFEKDDDTNGHLAFVAAASNLRANCYRIPPADALATKLTAGRIVPAIATTTSVVAGLSALELVKMAALRQHQKRASSKGQSIDAQKEPVAPLKVHRNAFLSLALPVFAFSEPVAAAVYPYGNNGLSEEGEDEEDEEGSEENGEAGKETYPATFTTWDRLQIDGRNGALPLSDVVARVERAAGPGAVLRSLSFGGRLLFTDYPPFDLPSRLRKPIIEILEEDPRQGTGGSDDDYSGRGEKMATARTSALQLPSFEGKQFVDLEALVEDEEDGELLDMPPVRVHLQEPK